MTDRWRNYLVHALTILAAAAAASLATPVAATAQQFTEHTRLEVLPLQLAVAGEALHPAADGDIAALLHVPGGWSVLDAAAILIDDPAWPASARYRLLTALLDQGAAVLELNPRSTTGRGADSTFAAHPSGGSNVLDALFGALVALKTEAGAGLVVAFGYGTTGDAALPAAEEATADRHLGFPRGLEGPRFAALGRVGLGRPAFTAGAALPEAEQWPLRAPLLCKLLADAVEGATRGNCLAALLPRHSTSLVADVR